MSGSAYQTDSGKPLIFTFGGGRNGPWRVDALRAVLGRGLTPVERLDVQTGGAGPDLGSLAWRLVGQVSNVRYAKRAELDLLQGRQEGLGRPRATRAALIPIRKTAAWWSLAQDERREIMEEQSRHIAVGLEYLPAISRRLHHSRDLGEPFDFLTWFEYAPDHADAFEVLVERLRASPEWEFVEREIDIRLTWEGPER